MDELRVIGNIGFVTAAVALVLFALLFLTSVRWWTDPLGRAIASVVATVAVICLLASIVLMGFPIPFIHWIRAILYPLLGVTAWSATIAFIWSQFFAPRRRVARVPSDETSTEGDAT